MILIEKFHRGLIELIKKYEYNPYYDRLTEEEKTNSKKDFKKEVRNLKNLFGIEKSDFHHLKPLFRSQADFKKSTLENICHALTDNEDEIKTIEKSLAPFLFEKEERNKENFLEDLKNLIDKHEETIYQSEEIFEKELKILINNYKITYSDLTAISKPIYLKEENQNTKRMAIICSTTLLSEISYINGFEKYGIEMYYFSRDQLMRKLGFPRVYLKDEKQKLEEQREIEVKQFSKELKAIVDKYKKLIKSLEDFKKIKGGFEEELEKLIKEHKIHYKDLDKMEVIFDEEDKNVENVKSKLLTKCFGTLLRESGAYSGVDEKEREEKWSKYCRILLNIAISKEPPKKPPSKTGTQENKNSDNIFIKKSLH